MISLKTYDSTGITPLGAILSWAAAAMATVTIVMNGYDYVKNRPKPPPILPLESDAIDAKLYGKNYRNEDRDRNGKRESYFRDPVTGIEYRARLNDLKELTLMPVRAR